MKKLFLVFAVVCITAISSKAQESLSHPTIFSVGVEASLPSGTFHNMGYNFGVGGSAQIEHYISTKASLTLNAGYISYSRSTGTNTYHINFLPVLAGVKYFASPKVYLQAQIGPSFNTKKDVTNSSYTAFAFSPGLGVRVSNNIDLLIKYLSNSSAGTTLSSFGARLAYNFR